MSIQLYDFLKAIATILCDWTAVGIWRAFVTTISLPGWAFSCILDLPGFAIALWRREKLITDEEFAAFSAETRNIVEGY
jgi:hypothetical protein